MNFRQSGRRAYSAAMRISAFSLVCAISVLAFGISDANARGGRGTMATSSVSGVNRGNVNTGNVNRGNINTGNVNRGNINTGNINNVNINRNVNVNVNNGYRGGYYGGHYHPIAAGAVIGAVAVTTAAIVGSYYRTLPPTGCSTVIMNGATYSHCGSVYYQQTWQGNDVVYVVVKP